MKVDDLAKKVDDRDGTSELSANEGLLSTSPDGQMEGKDEEKIKVIYFEDDENMGIPKDEGYSWVIATCAFLSTLLFISYNMSISALFVDISEEFSASTTITSLTFTFHAVSAGLSTLITSNVILGRVTARKICVCGGFLNSTATIALSLAPNMTTWLCLNAVKGIFFGALFISPLSMIGYYFKKRRGLASSFAFAGIVAAFVIFPPLASILRIEYGLRGALLISGSIELNAIPVCMLLRPISSYRKLYLRMLNAEKRPGYYLIKSKDSERQNDLAVPPSTYGKAAEERTKTGRSFLCSVSTFIDTSLLKLWTLRMVVGYMMFGVITMFTLAYMPAIAYQAGIDKTEAALLLTISGCMDLVVRLFVGFIADKNIISKEKLTMGSLSVIVVLTQFARYYTTYSLFVMFAMLSGIFIGFRDNLLNATLLDYFGADKTPKALGIIGMASTLMTSVNHPIVGALVDSTGNFTVALHYIGGCALVSVLILMTHPICKRWDEENRKKAEEAAKDEERRL